MDGDRRTVHPAHPLLRGGLRAGPTPPPTLAGGEGAWFAFQRWHITPGLVVFAKGVNSGYLPIGGVVMSAAVAETYRDRPYPGGLTYSGHPLACASAVAAVDIMDSEGVVEHARDLGTSVLGPALREVGARHTCVGEVRGAHMVPPCVITAEDARQGVAALDRALSAVA